MVEGYIKNNNNSVLNLFYSADHDVLSSIIIYIHMQIFKIQCGGAVCKKFISVASLTLPQSEA